MPELNERWLEEAAALRRAGTPFVLATVVAREAPQSARVGAHALVHADGRIEGWIGGGCVRPTVAREALAALAEGRPRLVRLNPGAQTDARSDVRVFPLTCQGEGAVDIYLEPVMPAAVLVVLGATPVGHALARLAPEVGLEVAVLDPATVPGGEAGVAQLAEQLAASLAAGRESFLVIATMGEGDEEALEVAVQAAGAAYLGLVASRKKAESLLAYLRARGVPAERMRGVKAPAGLDLGAATPGEIALSILAEIVQARRSRLAAGSPREPSAGAAVALEPVGEAAPARTVSGGAALVAETPGEETGGLEAPASAPAAGPQLGRARLGLPLVGLSAHDAAPKAPARTTAPAEQSASPAAIGGKPVPAGSKEDAITMELATDPVCGMTVDPRTTRHSHTLADGRTFYFCCPHCRTAFEREPQRYLEAAAQG